MRTRMSVRVCACACACVRVRACVRACAPERSVRDVFFNLIILRLCNCRFRLGCRPRGKRGLGPGIRSRRGFCSCSSGGCISGGSSRLVVRTAVMVSCTNLSYAFSLCVEGLLAIVLFFFLSLALTLFVLLPALACTLCLRFCLCSCGSSARFILFCFASSSPVFFFLNLLLPAFFFRSCPRFSRRGCYPSHDALALGCGASFGFHFGRELGSFGLALLLLKLESGLLGGLCTCVCVCACACACVCMNVSCVCVCERVFARARVFVCLG